MSSKQNRFKIFHKELTNLFVDYENLLMISFAIMSIMLIPGIELLRTPLLPHPGITKIVTIAFVLGTPAIIFMSYWFFIFAFRLFGGTIALFKQLFNVFGILFKKSEK